MKILLAAPPGVGKSTIIDAVVKQFPSAQGVVAREILDDRGSRTGFTSVNARGDSRQFMTLAGPGQGIVGDFTVDITAIEDFVIPEITDVRSGCALIYVDEIGRAQALSPSFLAVLRTLLRSDANVLASIVYDPEPWSLEFKSDESLCVIDVTQENRDSLPAILTAAFENAGAFHKLSKAQQRLVYKLLRKLLLAKQFVSARKLFDNAVVYATEQKIVEREKTPQQTTYAIAGKTHNHLLVRRVDGTFSCDCDLSNGRGMFVYPEPCSHQLSTQILLQHSAELV